jgi:hypothetical protein
MKGVAILLIIILLLVPTVTAGIYGVTIGSTDYDCEDKADVDITTSDGICPSDYASCDACLNADDDYIDDPDCCYSSRYCEPNEYFWCTDSEEICGDSSLESTIYELDSEGDNVDGTGSGDGTVENCAGTCTAGTENVIDDTNEPACADEVEDGTDLGYDVTENCADDAVLYRPVSYTSDVCSTDVSCHDTDDDGDLEICSGGYWHDADEAEEYCDAAGGSWETGTGTSDDDYNEDQSDDYCVGDDGYEVRGAILAEVSRGSEYCQAATESETGTEITVSIISQDDSSVVDSITTTHDTSWSYETFSCHEDATDNDVGSYEFSLSGGDYYLVTEGDGYNTATSTITVPGDDVDEDGVTTYTSFWIYLSEGCQPDCTMNDGLCYASCDGVNSCEFQTYDETGESVSTYCDGLSESTRYVLSEEEDADANTVSGYEVYCCTGTPQEYEREFFSAEDAETNCVEDIVAKEKRYWLNGEFVTFHFVLFSDPQPEKDDCEDYEEFMCDMYGGAWC